MKKLWIMSGLTATLLMTACIPEQTPREKAKDAYIFTYPLVMNYRTMYMQAIKGDGEMGKWLHLPLASPADTDIVTPNNDTPYSYAWLDLRTEPWVLTMPKIDENRFYTSQWDDFWGYVLDNAGSVNDGNGGVTVMLVSPSWDGVVPEGVDRVIRGESEFLGSLTRTQIIGGMEDMPKVKAIQKQYKLQPLSAYLGQPAPQAAPAIDWPEWTENDEMTLKYWDYVSLMLNYITPHANDAKMLAQLKELGIEAGSSTADLTEEQKAALLGGLKDARAYLKKLSQGKINASDFFNTREIVNVDYQNRALGVFMGIFGNTSDQSVYYSMQADNDGELLNGSKSYTLTFTKENLPPVKYFWSITMYKLPQRWLVDNSINRYSIGSATPGLKYNDDGSLTIYVSAKSPGADKESNWLPCPDGPFWTVMRTYGPDESIINGSYQRPNYEAVK